MPVPSFQSITSFPPGLTSQFPTLGAILGAKTPDALQALPGGNVYQASYLIGGDNLQQTLNVRVNRGACVLAYYLCQRDTLTDVCKCVKISEEEFFREFVCLLPGGGGTLIDPCLCYPPRCVRGCTDP